MPSRPLLDEFIDVAQLLLKCIKAVASIEFTSALQALPGDESERHKA